MMAAARIGVIGRLTLILMAALLAMTALTVGIDYLAHRNSVPHAASFPRIVHAAGMISLMRDADARRQSKIVRFATNNLVRAEIFDRPPGTGPDDVRAPKLEERLRAVVGPASGEPQAFTSKQMLNTSGAGQVEGWLTKVVAPLGDGRTLVVEWVDPPRITLLTFLGLPPGVWTGILGLLVAMLALFAVSREMRPLRRLTEAVSRFDGGHAPAADLGETGAPDVRRLTRAVGDMQQRVATLLGERSFLIGAISHDLRIYLTRLRLRAEAVAEPEARARLIGDLDGMASLVDASLAFTRATTSADKTRRVDLGDLVAVEVEEHAALGPQARLEGTYADDAIVAGDPVALRRVVANVLDNALKFARGAVKVRVDRTPTRERILIEDDGPGIAAAERKRVFDPFYRAPAPARGGNGLDDGGCDANGPNGSGLGLAIARQIVEAHGGTIEVVDAPGAAFLIALPPWRGGT